VAILIGYASRTRRVSEDAAIGIFLAASMALGILLLSVRRSYTAEIISYLFGSILAISRADLWIMAILGVVALTFVLGFYKELVFFTFDESLARASGIPTGFLHYLLMVLLAVLIVIAVKLVGIILVTAFLIIPGATVQLFARKFVHLSVGALVVGVVTSFAGLYLSFKFDLPSGAAIVMVQFALFVAALVISRLRARTRGKGLLGERA